MYKVLDRRAVGDALPAPELLANYRVTDVSLDHPEHP
jgi:hypothetical protein